MEKNDFGLKELIFEKDVNSENGSNDVTKNTKDGQWM